METIAPFDIEALKCDWIEGLPGEAFYARVQVGRELVERLPAADRARGVLIAETDPIEFAVRFFAAVSLGMPVILANPNWGEQEKAEMDSLLTVGNPTPRSILIPTGGSTGGVKLAIHNWDSLTAASRGVQYFIGGGPINSCCVLPLYHVSGLMQLIRSFITGGRLRFDEVDPADSCLSYVPTQLQRALQDPQCIQKLQTAKVIFVGGAALPQSVAEQACAYKLPIVLVYGMTETAAMIAAIPAEEFIANPNCGAQAIGEARFEVDSSGAIRIHSPALFSGYHGRPPVDLSDGYLTHDEGYIDDSGRLHIVGRMDRLINSGGEKIDPAEIEAALRECLGLSEMLVYGFPDEEWGQRLVVFYVPSLSQSLPEDWQRILKSHLAKFKIPKQMLAVEQLPLDGRGKIDTQQIHKLIETNTSNP
ncbi:MAG: AMP-binding protein [Opitutaceae bacterium]